MPTEQYPDPQQFKRNIAYKLRVGQILAANPVFEEDRIKHLSYNNKKVVRINLIANVIDKYIQDGEKKFGSLTLDDATGQIKIKVFGDDVEKFNPLQQGDTLLVIGIIRYWNNELYLTPEIIKKKEPSYLLVRKLESEIDQPKEINAEAQSQLKDKILSQTKEAEKSGGLEIESLILNLKDFSAETINSEIKKLLEEGLAYEPRPGKLRYLG